MYDKYIHINICIVGTNGSAIIGMIGEKAIIAMVDEKATIGTVDGKAIIGISR